MSYHGILCQDMLYVMTTATSLLATRDSYKTLAKRLL